MIMGGRAAGAAAEQGEAAMGGGHLADGWGRNEAEDDTLVRAGVSSLADRVRHQARALGRELHEHDGWVGAALADRGFLSNAVVVVRPPSGWDWAAPALTGLAPPGVPKLLVSPFPTPTSAATAWSSWAIRRSWSARREGPGRRRSPASRSARSSTTATSSPSSGRSSRRTRSPTWTRAHRRQLFKPAVLGGGTHLFLGLVDGEPVATATAHVAAGVNHVEFVSTRASHRGRGIGAAVTWAATVAEPGLPAVLISSDDGRGVYEAMGYLPVVRWTLWLAT